IVVSDCRPCRLQGKTTKERDHFLSKNMVNIPECGKLHLHLSKCSGGEPPDSPPKDVPPTLKMLLTPLCVCVCVGVCVCLRVIVLLRCLCACVCVSYRF